MWGAGAAALALASGALAQQPANREVILASTTSLYDTGLLDTLAARFDRETGYHLRVVAVGSGQALKMGERGDADVVFCHSPAAEATFMADGFGLKRMVVATNYFTIVGPPGDPAQVRGAPSAPAALRRIAAAGEVFVSRGDSSGTNARELALWRAAGGRPDWPGYIETGQGQANSLMVADQRRGYMLTDYGTFDAMKSRLELVPLRDRDSTLLNVYHVIELNPERHPRMNVAGGNAFAEWLVRPGTQDFIGRFGVERYGAALFVPARGVEP